MTTFLNDTNPNCATSSCTIGKVKYLFTKRPVIEGDGFIFTVDEPDRERESILLTSNEARALFYLMSSKGEKK